MVGTPFRHLLPAMSVEDKMQSRLVQVREAIAIGEEQLLLALALNHEGEIERLGRFVRELRAWQDLIQLAVEANGTGGRWGRCCNLGYEARKRHLVLVKNGSNQGQLGRPESRPTRLPPP